jgi:hypothetical protein
MANQLTIQNSLNFVSSFIAQQTLLVNGMDPALTMANMILQRMLKPPFIWRGNRGTLAQLITNFLGSDYVTSAPTLDRIETQWLVDGSGNIYELTGALSIPRPTSGNVTRPSVVSPQYDDGNGNITFRFNAIPDQEYTAYFDFQQKPTPLTSLGMGFAPMSDDFAYIFNALFLGWAGWINRDARAPIWVAEGISALLGAQDGLSEQAKAIFLQDWLATMGTVTRATQAAQMGSAARSK